MRCKHCCVNASPLRTVPNELASYGEKLLKQRIDEMVLFGIKEFYISGGEPFLIDNIFSLLEYLKTKKTKINIATNGYLLDENITKGLSRLKINLLHISLDGHLPRVHNSFRGGNVFNQVIKNIKMLRGYKIPIRIGCIIWRKNENFLEEMVKLCVNLRIEELRFSLLIKVGRFKSNPSIYPKRKPVLVMKEIGDLRKQYRDKIKITIHRGPWGKNNNSSQFCPGGDKLFFLNSGGNLSPCSWIAKIDSNFLTKKSLREEKFVELTQEKEILEFKRLIKTRNKKGFKGCPFMAKCQNSSYYSNDNLC